MITTIMTILISLGIYTSNVEVHNAEAFKNTELMEAVMEADKDFNESSIEMESENYEFNYHIDVNEDSAVVTIDIDVKDEKLFKDMTIVSEFSSLEELNDETNLVCLVDGIEIDFDEFYEYYWAFMNVYCE